MVKSELMEEVFALNKISFSHSYSCIQSQIPCLEFPFFAFKKQNSCWCPWLGIYRCFTWAVSEWKWKIGVLRINKNSFIVARSREWEHHAELHFSSTASICFGGFLQTVRLVYFIPNMEREGWSNLRVLQARNFLLWPKNHTNNPRGLRKPGVYSYNPWGTLLRWGFLFVGMRRKLKINCK